MGKLSFLAATPRSPSAPLVDEKELPSDLVEAIDKFKFRGSSGKVNSGV